MHALMAAILLGMAWFYEAKKLMARLREIDPLLRTSNLQNLLGPYRQPEYPAKFADALRKAGLPE